MNDAAIFIKTPAGEEAIRERERLVQRNLRMVLILVDGVADVADLRRRAGDSALVDSALMELERMGLVESLDTRVTRGIQFRAGPPTLTEIIEPTNAARTPAMPQGTPFDVEAAAAVSHPSFEPMTAEPELTTGPSSKSLVVTVTEWWQRMGARRGQAREEAIYENAYGQEDNDAIKDLPIRQASFRIRKFKLGPMIALALAGALVLGVLRVVLYPYEEYRPRIEARLARMLDDEVRVGNVRVSFMPLPVIVLEEVTVGAEVYAIANSVRLAPEFGSLLDGRQFRQIKVEGLLLRNSGLDRLARWFRPAGMENAGIPRIDVQNLSLDLGWVRLDGLRGSAEIDEQRGLTGFNVHGGHADFHLLAVPGPTGLAITAKAGDWKLPVTPPLYFAALELSGILSPGRFVVEKIDGRAYDGLIDGRGVIAWRGAPTLALELDLKHIGAGKLLTALDATPLLDGELTGHMQIASDAPSGKWLDRSLRMDGQFTIYRGSLRRIDLAEAIRPSGPTGGKVRGGSTGFEEFAGTLAMDSGTLRLANLRLVSGRMRATGQASISRQSAMITGIANVELRSSANVIRSPVAVSGSIADPQLKLGR